MNARRPDLWEGAFLAALPRTDGEIRSAADFAGVHRAQIYRRMKRSEEFRSRVSQVLSEIRDARIQHVLAQ